MWPPGLNYSALPCMVAPEAAIGNMCMSESVPIKLYLQKQPVALTVCQPLCDFLMISLASLCSPCLLYWRAGCSQPADSRPWRPWGGLIDLEDSGVGGGSGVYELLPPYHQARTRWLTAATILVPATYRPAGWSFWSGLVWSLLGFLVHWRPLSRWPGMG